MTTDSPSVRTARFVVTLGELVEAEAHLEWLAGMAHRLRYELHAYVIEDERSASLTSLACSRLISRSSGRTLELDAVAMRRAHHVTLVRQRTRLEQVATRMGLPLALKESAADTATDLAELGPDDVVTIVNLSSDLLALPNWAMAAKRAMAAIVRPRGRNLTLVYRDNPKAVGVAEQVMRYERLRLRIILLGDAFDPAKPRIPPEIEALCARWPAAVDLFWQAWPDPAGLRSKLSEAPARVLILDRIGNITAEKERA